MRPKGTARILRIVLSCLLSTVFVGLVPIEAKNVGQPFDAVIRVENPESQINSDSYTVKAGSEVFITVHLTNVSKHNLAFDYDSDSRTGVPPPLGVFGQNPDGNRVKGRDPEPNYCN